MAAEEKAKYEKMAAADKERYAKEMESYEPPSDDDDDDDQKKPAAKKKKAKKDPNAPKKGLSSFMIFSQKMRPKVKAENPELTFGELGKKMGELFKALSPEEKEPYEALAQADKERSAKATAAYESKKQADDDGVNDDDDDAASDDDDDDDDDSDDDSD